MHQKGIYDVVVYDNLATGHRESVPEGITFVHGDVRDTELLTDTLKKYKIQCVLHFSASSLVGESV